MVTYYTLTIAHTFQDKSKVIYNTQFERDNFWTFYLDEFVHLFIIILVAFNLNGLTPNIICHAGLIYICK